MFGLFILLFYCAPVVVDVYVGVLEADYPG